MRVYFICIYFIILILNNDETIGDERCTPPEDKVDYTNYDTLVIYTRYATPTAHEDVIKYEYRKPTEPENIETYERRFIVDEKNGKPKKHGPVNLPSSGHSRIKISKVKTHIFDEANQDLMEYAQGYINNYNNTLSTGDRLGIPMLKRKGSVKERRKRGNLINDDQGFSDNTEDAVLIKLSTSHRRMRHKMWKENVKLHQVRTVEDAIRATAELLKFQHRIRRKSIIENVLNTNIKLLRNYKKYIVSKTEEHLKYIEKDLNKTKLSKRTKKVQKNRKLLCFKLVIIPTNVIHTKGLQVKRSEYKFFIGSSRPSNLPTCTQNETIKDKTYVKLSTSRKKKKKRKIRQFKYKKTVLLNKTILPVGIAKKRKKYKNQLKYKTRVMFPKREKRTILPAGTEKKRKTNKIRLKYKNVVSSPIRTIPSVGRKNKRKKLIKGFYKEKKSNIMLPSKMTNSILSSKRILLERSPKLEREDIELRYTNGSSVCMYVIN